MPKFKFLSQFSDISSLFKGKQQRIKYILSFVVIIIFISSLLWAARLSYHTYLLYKTASSAKLIIEGGIDKLSLNTSVNLLSEINVHSRSVKKDLWLLLPIFNTASNIPLHTTKSLGNIEPLLDYVIHISESGLALVKITDLWEYPELSVYPPNQKVLLVLMAGEALLQDSIEAINAASQARAEINASTLPGRIRDNYLEYDAKFKYIDSAIRFLPHLPQVMGLNQPQTYLIVAQNQDELRASGGFITAIGTVTFESGTITSIDIRDSYQIDDFSKNYPKAPFPLEKYMEAWVWVIRDANWSPDFPTSAQQIQSLYSLSTNTPTNGVIVFDQFAIASILNITGPIQLQEYPEIIDASNVEEFMHHEVSPYSLENLSEEWWRNRKNFMPLLGQEILERLLSIQDFSTFADLLMTMETCLEEGHLLVYFNNNEVEALLHQAGLDGSINAGTEDFFMLVDSNIGFNKANALIQRFLIYSVDLRNPEAPFAFINIHYKHQYEENVVCTHEPIYGELYTDMQKRCYWNYWRVLTNGTTKMVGVQAPDVPAEWLLTKEAWNSSMVFQQEAENGTQSIEGLMVLPTGMEQDIYLNLSLSPAILQISDDLLIYSLRIQKQSGIDNLPVRLQIAVPDGYYLEDDSGEWQSDGSNIIWTWQGYITRNRDFRLVFNRK